MRIQQHIVRTLGFWSCLALFLFVSACSETPDDSELEQEASTRRQAVGALHCQNSDCPANPDGSPDLHEVCLSSSEGYGTCVLDVGSGCWNITGTTSCGAGQMCAAGACGGPTSADPSSNTVSSIAPAESLYAMSVRIFPDGETPVQVGADFSNAMVVPRSAMEFAIEHRGYDVPSAGVIAEASTIAGLANDPAILGIQGQYTTGLGTFVTVSSDIFIVIDDIKVRETGDGFVEGSDFSVVVTQGMSMRTPWYGSDPRLLMVENRAAGTHACCDTELVDKKCKVDNDVCDEFPVTCNGPLSECFPPGLDAHQQALFAPFLTGDPGKEPFRAGALLDGCGKGNGLPSVGLYVADPRSTSLTTGNYQIPSVECEICKAVSCPADPLDPPPDSTPPMTCSGARDVPYVCTMVQLSGVGGIDECDDQRGPASLDECKRPYSYGGLSRYSTSSSLDLNPCGTDPLPAYCGLGSWAPGEAPADCTNGGNDPSQALFVEARLRMAGLLACAGALPSSADPYANLSGYSCCGAQNEDMCSCLDNGNGTSQCWQCNANGDCNEYKMLDDTLSNIVATAPAAYANVAPDGTDAQDESGEDDDDDEQEQPSADEEPDVVVEGEFKGLVPEPKQCANGQGSDGKCNDDPNKPNGPPMPPGDPFAGLDLIGQAFDDYNDTPVVCTAGISCEIDTNSSPNEKGDVTSDPNGPEDSPGGVPGKNTGADPVVLATGEMWIRSMDMAFAGAGNVLRFERQYTSKSGHRGILGSNWKHNYEYRIKPIRRGGGYGWAHRFLKDDLLQNQAVELEMPDGSMRVFYWDAIQSKRANLDVFLPQAGAFGHVVFKHGEWTWRDVHGGLIKFNEFGHPTSIRDRFGKGVSLEYEPIPLYALYARYCGVSASAFYRFQLDTRACSTMARVFDPHIFQDVDLEGWGDPNDPFIDSTGIDLVYEDLGEIQINSIVSSLYSDLTFVDARWEIMAALLDYRSYVRWWFDLGPLPGLPTGSQRQRPVAVVDDLGRRLEFSYHDHTEREKQGLLETITGPGGVRITYDYDAPAAQDPRTNEQFLVQAIRSDTAPSQSGKMAGVVSAPSRTTDYTYAWPASGFESFDGSGASGAYTDRVRTSYLEYFGHIAGCRLTDGGVTEVCFDAGHVCASSDQCTNASTGYCMLVKGERQGNPCFLASEEEGAYVSSVADNIVRVSHDGVIESETVYQANPDADDFDRATHQRYGGLPHSEYSAPVAPRVTGSGFVSDYPDYILEYVSTGPASGISGDKTDAFLPAHLRTRFALESSEVEPVDPDEILDPVGQCTTAPDQTLIDAYDPVCDMGTFELTNRQQAYCDMNQGVTDAAEDLPGFVPQRPYFDSESAKLNDKLWRSRVPCQTLAAFHLSDPTHNGVMSKIIRDSNDDPSHIEIGAGQREQVQRDLRRICAWTKSTDREGDVTFYGMNYRGQHLVMATKVRGEQSYVITETLYTADGKVREERDPTLSDTTWAVGDGHTSFQYDEIDPSADEDGDHLQPWWWNRRARLKRVEEYPGPGGVLAHEWSSGTTIGAGEVIEKRVVDYEYESLFELVRSVGTSVVVGGVKHELRKVIHDYDYQELSQQQLVWASSKFVQHGFPLYVLLHNIGSEGWDTAIAQMYDAPVYGDLTNGVDLNGDETLGVVYNDSDPDRAPPIHGALVRSSILDMTGAQPEVVRSVMIHPGLRGQTAAIYEPDHAFITFSYFESDGLGDGLGADDPEAVALAGRYEHGLLARTAVERFPSGVPEDIDVLDPQGNPTTLTSCEHLPGSYRWMLPGGCAGENVQQAYDRLETELGIEGDLVDRIRLMADANTSDDYSSSKFAYNELGQVYLAIRDGVRTSYTHDTDGLLLARTEHYPVTNGAPTASAPIKTVATLGRTLKGYVGYARVEGGSGNLLSESFAQYDDEGNMVTTCAQVEAGSQCSSALGAGSSCNGVSSVLSARACAQAINTFDQPVDLHNSREVDDPSYLLTTMRYTPEGLLSERKTPAAVHESFGYDAFGRLTFYGLQGVNGESEQVEYEYDPRGRRTKTTFGFPGQLSLSTSYFYDGFDRLVRELDERGVNHHMAYDRLGLLSAYKVGTSAYGSSNPKPSSKLESLWRYDATGRLIASSKGGGDAQSAFGYAPGSMRPVAVSQTGRGTRWMTYDGQGRGVWSLDGEGNQRVFFDDMKAHVMGEATMRRSSKSPGAYLSNTLIANVQDSDADMQRLITFGHNGEMVRASFVRRDGLGRTLRFIKPDGTETNHTYDLSGMPITSSEQSESGTDLVSRIYDAFGHVTDIYEPVAGERTSYEYDGLGRLAATYLPMAPNDPMRQYDYDPLGRVTRQTLRTGPGTYEFVDSTYNASGDLENLYWEDNVGGGATKLKEYAWDDAKRPTSIIHYNPKLASLGFSNTKVDVSRSYDGLGRVTSETSNGLDMNLTVDTPYSVSGGSNLDATVLRRAVIPPSLRRQIRRQNKVGQVDEITIVKGSPVLATHQLDWMGGLLEGRTVDFGQSGVDDFRYLASYDPTGRMEHHEYRAVSLLDPDQPADAQWGQDYCANGSWSADPCAAPLFEVDVRHDTIDQVVATRRRFANPLRAGNGKLIGLSSRAWPFRGYDHSKQGFLQKEWLFDAVKESDFDSLSSHQIGPDQLNWVTGGITGSVWNWVRSSKVGSLTSIELDSDPNTTRFVSSTQLSGHRLDAVMLDSNTNEIVFSVEHDGQGRVIYDGNYRYVWNALGELVLAYDAAATNPSPKNYVEAYGYDADGRLSQVRAPSVPDQMFVYDGPHKLAAYKYSKVSPLLLWEATWGTGIDDLIGFRDAAGEYEVLTDERHSPVGLWKHLTLELVAQGDFDANGRMSTQPPNMSGGGCAEPGSFGTSCLLTTNAGVMPFAFNGAWKSSITGMSQMRFRWYSPALGQFVSHDPLGPVDSYNLYSFAKFGPNTRWDPYGLKACGFVCALDAMERGAAKELAKQAQAARDAYNSGVKTAEELVEALGQADGGAAKRLPGEAFDEALNMGKGLAKAAAGLVNCVLSPIMCTRDARIVRAAAHGNSEDFWEEMGGLGVKAGVEIGKKALTKGVGSVARVGKKAIKDKKKSKHNMTPPRSRVREVVRNAMGDDAGEGLTCEQCARRAQKALEEEGIKGNRVVMDSDGAIGWVDDDGLTIPLAENGHHEWVDVDGIVYDNMNPDGIPKDEFLRRLKSGASGQDGITIKNNHF